MSAPGKGVGRGACARLLALALAVFALAGCAPQAKRVAPTVIDGRLDVRGWDFERDGPISLEGVWGVAWDVLADRNAEVPAGAERGTIRVPSLVRNAHPPETWRNETGNVTFMIDLDGLSLETPLALSFGPLFPTETTCVSPAGTSVSAGLNLRPFVSAHESIAPYVIALPRADSLRCTLSMSVAEWHVHGGAGLWSAPMLASSKAAFEHHDNANIRFTAAAALLVTLASFFLAQWSLRRKDIEPLAVAVFMASCAVWFAGFAHIWDSWSWFSAPWRKRCEFAAVPVLGTSGLWMTHALVRERWSRLSVTFAALGLAVTALLLFGPLTSLHGLLTLAQVVTLLLILRVSVVAYRGYSRKEDKVVDGRLLLAGLAAPAAMGATEIIVSVLTGARFGLTLLGVVGLAFTLAFVLARRNAYARRSSESFAAATRKFVPVEFLAALGHQDVTTVALGDASVRELTVLFADLRGFTAMSENLSAEETFALVNRCLSCVAPSIRANGGFVDKYIGDAVMALFPGSPASAVRAAIDMQVGIARNRDLGRGNLRASIGVGIHVGRVMMGTIGEAERFEATVISDAVNLTSRLESLTKQFGCSVLVSGEVHAELGEELREDSRPLGTFVVKGRTQPVVLHEVFASESDAVRLAKSQSRDRLEAMLEAFQRDDTQAALEVAAELRDAYPEDGPVNWWFLRLVREATADESTAKPAGGIVRLEEK